MKPRSSAVETARRASEDRAPCGWWSECRHDAVAEVWLRSQLGVDRRQVCEAHLAVAGAIGYQLVQPQGDGKAVGG